MKSRRSVKKQNFPLTAAGQWHQLPATFSRSKTLMVNCNILSTRNKRVFTHDKKKNCCAVVVLLLAHRQISIKSLVSVEHLLRSATLHKSIVS